MSGQKSYKLYTYNIHTIDVLYVCVLVNWYVFNANLLSNHGRLSLEQLKL